LIRPYQLFNFFSCPYYYFEAADHYPDHLIAALGFQPVALPVAGRPDFDPDPGFVAVVAEHHYSLYQACCSVYRFPEMFFALVADVEAVVAEHHYSLYQVCCSVFRFLEMFFVPVADVEALHQVCCPVFRFPEMSFALVAAVAAYHYSLFRACYYAFHFPEMLFVPVADVEAVVADHHYSLYPVYYSFSVDLLFHFPVLLLKENFFFVLFLNYL
jgi:hypothetical protein